MADANLVLEPLPNGWRNWRFGDICDRVKESYRPVEGGERLTWEKDRRYAAGPFQFLLSALIRGLS